MNVTNINKAKGWFEVLETSERSQTAVMTLAPEKIVWGKSRGAHNDSDRFC